MDGLISYKDSIIEGLENPNVTEMSTEYGIVIAYIPKLNKFLTKDMRLIELPETIDTNVIFKHAKRLHELAQEFKIIEEKRYERKITST